MVRFLAHQNKWGRSENMSDNRERSLFASDTTPEEHTLRKIAFQAILDGEPINRDGLVKTTIFTREKVEVLMEDLIKRGLVVVESESGRIVGCWGLSTEPTSHKLQIRGRKFYTWCAEDAVGIPAGLGEDASIVSKCHQCDNPVNIEMSAGQVVHAKPPDVLLWVTAIEVGRSVVGFT
jgi:alkylmercury lyase